MQKRFWMFFPSSKEDLVSKDTIALRMEQHELHQTPAEEAMPERLPLALYVGCTYLHCLFI
jgi:hypothetical protein